VPYLLALDEGTTSARTALYNEAGERLAMESARIACAYPNPGWVEQNADDIWSAQIESARRVLDQDQPRIEALGITNQRETTVVWERATGRPVNPAIVWQCRRTAPACERLSASGASAEITAKTGLVLDAYFSATKIRWILEHTPDGLARARDGELLFGTVDTWLIWKLTNGAVHVTDVSNASRTLLMNLATGDWDPSLLDTFGVPAAMLPRIVRSSEVVGVTHGEHLGAEIPIAGIAGDQQAALAGQACFRAGLSKNTYGTGCFALMHSGDRAPVSKHGLLATRAASADATGQFAVEGSIFIAGAAVQWLRDKAGLLAHAAESESLARSVDSTGGVYFVPAFVGLGAPHWDSAAKGMISGMTLGTSKAHIVRATLESIAYQTRDLADAMKADTGHELEQLRVDGGASANDFLMQFQADILGCPIVRPADIETTALGAAYLAGLAVGFWRDVAELESFWRPNRIFEPQMSVDQRESLFDGWKKAVARCRFE
jgi:glycerol kinase